MSFTETELITFLPHFLDEELYLVSSDAITNNKIEILDNTTLEVGILTNVVPEIEQKLVLEPTKIESTIEKSEILTTKTDLEPIQEPRKSEVIVPEQLKNEKFKPVIITKKVVILVSYTQGVPEDVAASLYKIFEALHCQKSDIELVNVTVANSDLLAPYQFQYLILMGGKGKTLNFLKEYTGERNILEVGKTKNATVIFADKLDVYLKPENLALKKLFWNTLKTTITN